MLSNDKNNMHNLKGLKVQFSANNYYCTDGKDTKNRLRIS